jgi:hypothetical protein
MTPARYPPLCTVFGAYMLLFLVFYGEPFSRPLMRKPARPVGRCRL